MLDVSMNTQAIAVERFSGRVLMPGFHGSWSTGALVGAVVGASAVGLGVSLSEQLLSWQYRASWSLAGSRPE